MIGTEGLAEVAELSEAARAMRSAPVRADREDRFLLSVAAMLEIEAAFCEAEGVPPRPAPLIVARTYLATRRDAAASVIRAHSGGPKDWPHA